MSGPDWQQLQAEALTVVAAAAEQDVPVRVVGSGGIRLHCDPAGELMDAVDRPAKDIDLVVLREDRKTVRRLLESRGYEVDRDLLVAMEGRRYTFSHPATGTDVDVFVERLDFCHPIDVRDRLRLHPVTIPIDELLLQKLQIVEMTETDVLDVGILLATHPVGGGGPEAVDADRIAALLARDWGFHHTVCRNLDRISGAGLPAHLTGQVAAGVTALRTAIDAAPKSMGWRMRDKVGERKQWWQDVDEKEATY
jgi:Uncharacterised nucleotidyltransferase